MGELACVVFKDGLGCLATGCVEEHDRGDIVPVRLGDAGYLLGQDPHGDAVVPGAEAEIDQLPRAALDIFRRGAVIQYEQGVGARKEEAGQPQPVPISCCRHTITKMCVSRSTKPLYVLFLTKVGQRSTM